MAARNGDEQDPEILAITSVYSALRSLNTDAQQRVMDYVARKLGLTSSDGLGRHVKPEAAFHARGDEAPVDAGGDADAGESGDTDGFEGISPAAKKWMRRSDFSSEQLSRLFSLGIDDIDLVAKKVPGRSQRDKTRSVMLLKGIASYLGSGVPRVTYEQIREACQHYGAFDNTNFSKYLKTMLAEVSGTKETGFTLTARGLTEATELVRSIVTAEQ